MRMSAQIQHSCFKRLLGITVRSNSWIMRQKKTLFTNTKLSSPAAKLCYIFTIKVKLPTFICLVVATNEVKSAIEPTKAFHTVLIVIKHQITQQINIIIRCYNLIPIFNNCFIMFLNVFKATRTINEIFVMTKIANESQKKRKYSGSFYTSLPCWSSNSFDAIPSFFNSFINSL